MGLFSRRKSSADRRTDGPGRAGRRRSRHLKDFVATRVGVEAYVEPHDQRHADDDHARGHRRGVDAPSGAGPEDRLASSPATWGSPSYDVQRTGYPQRVRDWNSRQRLARKRKHA